MMGWAGVLRAVHTNPLRLLGSLGATRCSAAPLLQCSARETLLLAGHRAVFYNKIVEFRV